MSAAFLRYRHDSLTDGLICKIIETYNVANLTLLRGDHSCFNKYGFSEHPGYIMKFYTDETGLLMEHSHRRFMCKKRLRSRL